MGPDNISFSAERLVHIRKWQGGEMQEVKPSKRDRDTAEALEKKKKAEAYLDKIRGCLIGAEFR